MNPVIWAIAIIVVAMVAVAAYYVGQRQHSHKLRTHFGPEYDHTVEGYGERRAAERALVDRTKRVEKLEIRPLPAMRRDEYASRWQAVQSRFVDDPVRAFGEAHALLASVMHDEGYPTGHFKEEVELLSVHHPAAVQHYRAAQRLAEERERGQGATEDLRQALIHYRALFEDLLKVAVPRDERAPEVRT